MIKKIPVSALTIGMYIDNLGVQWLEHDFLRSSFMVNDLNILDQLTKNHIDFVYINTEKGIDIGPTIPDHHFLPNTKQKKPPSSASASNEEEKAVAKHIVNQTNVIMKNMMTDVRLGKQVEVEILYPLADKMIASIKRNSDTLISLARIKTKDDYTFMHSVAVSGLMIAFASASELDENAIRDVALGGLLHDIGKMLTPIEILNKPGKLTDEEFVIMRNHVQDGKQLLQNRTDLSKNTTDVIFQHHEKIDGSGYPLNLKGNQISCVGKMSAIVDIYDALTSKRSYKSAWEPALTLKKMLQWTDNQLDRELMIKFIRCLGIYPVGSLIEMDSGRIGIVLDQNETNLTHPTVKFIFKKNHGYLFPKIVDLTKEQHDFIIDAIPPEKYGIDMSNFI